jgi:hypothetical protein
MMDSDGTQRQTRREFLVSAAAVAGLFLVRPLLAATRVRGGRTVHPDPRPGITSAAVLDPSSVPERSRPGYEAARAIPEILDGLYCHCDCAQRDGLRSLLSCFETRMPVGCGICSGEAQLAHRLSREGRTLSAIRKAVDDRYK